MAQSIPSTLVVTGNFHSMLKMLESNCQISVIQSSHVFGVPMLNVTEPSY